LGQTPRHKGGVYFFPHTYTQKQKQKEQSKLKIQKTILREPKKGKKENQQETTEIK